MYKSSRGEGMEGTMRSEGIVLEIRAYRNGNSFFSRLLEVVRLRCVRIASPCLFSRRIVNETRINCENFNPEKKSTTAYPKSVPPYRLNNLCMQLVNSSSFNAKKQLSFPSFNFLKFCFSNRFEESWSFESL